MIDNETKERILAAAKIEEVVGDFVKLHRSGSNLKGLCPFHEEKTPSFMFHHQKISANALVVAKVALL